MIAMRTHLSHHMVTRHIPTYLHTPPPTAAAEAAVEAANAAKVEASTARRALEKAKVGVYTIERERDLGCCCGCGVGIECTYIWVT